MFKKLLFCVLTIVVITAKAQFPSPYVVANIDWIKYYSQRDTVSTAPTSIDANSNVFTTGYSGFTSSADLVALKYDSLGVQQYVYAYNGGSYDIGKAIKIDASGNCYLAGITTATTGLTARNYIIVKLNSSGTQQWLKTYDRGASNDDEATDIVVDANGDVYVTGRSRNSSGNFDIVTLKLNGTTGNTSWTHIYTGSGFDDEGVAMVLSANGSYLYITGNTFSSTSGNNIVTYALNAGSGTAYWSPVTSNGSANGNDKSAAIILHGTDIVVCGEKTNSSTGLDYAVMKYNGSNGTSMWQNSYDFSNMTNRATALVRDSAGNIGVVGTVNNAGVYAYHTVFYTGNGFQYAVNIENTGLNTLVTDPTIANDTIAHHWYVGGEKLMSTKDIFVYQITPAGNTSWRQTIDGGDTNNDAATAIAVNGVGVIYVGALCRNSSAQFDYTTIKLNQTPVYWPPDFTNQPVNLKHLYLKNSGQLQRTDSTLASEVLYYTHNTSPEVFIEQNGFNFVNRKINSVPSNTNTNVLDTTERIKCKFLYSNPLAAQHELVPRSTVYNYWLGYASNPSITDVQGNERIFIPNLYNYTDMHYYSDNKGLKYYFVLKPYATNEITMEIDGSQSTSIDGTTGNLIITGALGTIELKKPIAYTTNTLGAVVTMTGSASWVNVTGNRYKIGLPGYSISNPVIIQVSTSSPSGVGYGPKANLDYSTFYGGLGNEMFNDIKAAANGDRLVTGWADGSSFPDKLSIFLYKAQRDAVILKYTADDTLRVASFMGGSRDDVGNSIEVNSSNQVFVGGNTFSTDFPALPLFGASNQTANGYVTIADYEDGFLAKFLPTTTSNFKPSLGQNWTRYFGGPRNDEINGIHVDGSGNLYFVGEAHSSTIGGLVSAAQATNANNNNSSDVILGKFSPSLAMVYGTFLGGYNTPFGAASREIGYDITVDNNGNAVVVGQTDAINFPCVNSTGNTNTWYDNSIANQSGPKDGFIARYSSTGTKQFASFFGGNGIDALTRVAHDPLYDDIYFGGDSYDTTNFPFLYKSGAFNSRYKSYRTAFVGQMAGDLTKKWCTFYGAGTNSAAFTASVSGLCVDGYGVLYVSGMTTSDTIRRPSTQPTTVVYRDSIKNNMEGFVAVFSPYQTLYHAHYYGGSNVDQINGADVSQNQKLYVVGNTQSADFPIAYNSGNATLIDSIYRGGSDGYISRFDLNKYQITGINEYSFNNSQLIIYPNPTSSGFNLELQSELKSKITMKVFNLMGQLIHEQDVKEQTTAVNCDSWSNGVYLISISDAKSQKTFKLIKN